MKRLLLLGAGHAQLAVLAALARRRMPGAEVLLVSPGERLLYSGMVPGLISDRYRADDCSIPVAPLARAAGVQFLRVHAVSLDAAAHTVALADGRSVEFDVLSLNTGPAQNRDLIPGAREHALFLRPINAFVQLWRRTRDLADEDALRIVVIGGGAAGVEIALAVGQVLGQRHHVTLVCDGPVLPTYADSARRRALAALKRRGVQLLPGLCTSIEAGHVVAGSMRVACDVPIMATGTDAPAWLANSGLALTERGFVRVGATLQSPSHANVFAAGDVMVRDDATRPSGGVDAVRAGPVLADNLRRFIAGAALRPDDAQRRALSLLATGDGAAIASWGDWACQGRLMGWWKDRIDRAFIARYREGYASKK